MTPTVPIPLGGSFKNPFPQWLDQVSRKFSHGGPESGPKVNPFLGRVRIQAELAEGCARLLGSALESGAEALPTVSDQLIVCSVRAREMDEEMTSRLTKAVLTPYDSEDLKTVSCILARLVDSTRDIALEVEGSNFISPGYSRIQNALITPFAAANALVGELGNREREQQLWDARRQARRAFRQEHAVAFKTLASAEVVAADGVFRRFTNTLTLLKRLNMAACWLRYKNS